MTARRLVQNFRHLRGIVWGGPATAADTLQTTLARLGMSLVRAQDADLIALDCNRDVIFADGDCDLDPALIRRPGTTLPPAPTIGLVGVEAPSRLKMLDELGATAFLRKPIHAAAVYSSLFLAVNGYHRLRLQELALAEHDRRRGGRRFVIKAVVHLVQTAGLSDDAAYARLRRESMRVRRSLEEYCESWMARPDLTTTLEMSDEAKPDARCGDGRDASVDAVGGAGRRSDQARRA